jgi:hypothetical protein
MTQTGRVIFFLLLHGHLCKAGILMIAIDPIHLHAHRRTETAEGWPMLRSCPNTSAVRLVRYLDSLTPSEINVLLNQWEAHDMQPKVDFKTIEEATAALERFPAIVAYNTAITRPVRSIMTLPIKTVAGSLADVGGNLEDWARVLHIEPDGMRLQPPLVESPQDLVPVAPRILRKALAEAASHGFDAEAQKVSPEETWYVSKINDWDVALDVTFVSNKGWNRSHQFDYAVWVKSPAGKRILLQGYESLWRIPTHWNYITAENVGRSTEHLVTLVKLMVSLVRT